MKKLFAFAVVSGLSVLASAQGTTSNSTTAPNSKTVAIAPSNAAPTTGSTVANLEDSTKDKRSSKFGGILISQSSAALEQVNDEKINNSSVVSVNAVGLSYKMSEDLSVSARHYFSYITNIEKNKDAATLKAKKYQPGYTALDPAVIASFKVAGNASSLWFYVPASEYSRSVNRIGQLRFDSGYTFFSTPKVSLDYSLSSRIFGNAGSEANFRLIQSIGPSYNFTDKMGIYASVGHDTIVSKLWNATKVGETAVLEAGFNAVLGSIVINPAITEYVDSKDLAFGNPENMAYNLNLVATF